MRPAVLLFFGVVGLAAQDQPAAPPKTVLDGKVVNSASGEPVRKALVSLFAQEGKPGRSALTDAEGKFEFASIEPGTYLIAVSHEGFVEPNRNGKLRRERVTIAPAEEKRDMVIRITPLTYIAGRMVSEDGDPIRRVNVEALAYQYTSSGRRLVSRGSAFTNDLGEYRIFDLEPGKYYLKADSMMTYDGDTLGEAYYPGTADPAGASVVEVGGAQPAEGIDMTLRPAKVAHIRGQVMNPGENLMVGLYHADENGSSNSNSSVEDPKGKFDLPHVSPGSYMLTAEATIDGRHYAAHLPVHVGTTDLEGIELHLVPPIEIAGQIRIEGKTDAKVSRLGVMLEDEGQMRYGMDGGRPKEDGSFTMDPLTPGIYQVTAYPLDDLYLKAVRWSDRDVLESGLDLTQGGGGSGLVVVFSASGGKIDGVVQDDQSAPAEQAMVLLMPAEAQRKKALVKLVRTDHAGHFTLQGIAPGSYKLYAFADADPDQAMYDPDFLKPFASRAESVEISENSRKSFQLTLIKTADQPAQ